MELKLLIPHCKVITYKRKVKSNFSRVIADFYRTCKFNWNCFLCSIMKKIFDIFYQYKLSNISNKIYEKQTNL